MNYETFLQLQAEMSCDLQHKVFSSMTIIKLILHVHPASPMLLHSTSESTKMQVGMGFQFFCMCCRIPGILPEEPMLNLSFLIGYFLL